MKRRMPLKELLRAAWKPKRVTAPFGGAPEHLISEAWAAPKDLRSLENSLVDWKGLEVGRRESNTPMEE